MSGMARPVLLALLLIPGAAGQDPAPATIQLEIRVFDGQEDVTSDTRIAVFKAGEREAPLARLEMRDGRKALDVPEGFYDVQAVRERDGRVLTIRWAERLVVMPYPDERGHHLQVINLRPGFGALQIRHRKGSAPPDVRLFPEGRRDPGDGKDVMRPVMAADYALFVVPAGRYDVRVGPEAQPAWHAGIDVPLDRTRLWFVPDSLVRFENRPTPRGGR
jgi:hypothetical protein